MRARVLANLTVSRGVGRAPGVAWFSDPRDAIGYGGLIHEFGTLAPRQDRHRIIEGRVEIITTFERYRYEFVELSPNNLGG